MYPLARKSLSTNRNAFKNMFPLYGKIKLAVAAGVSQNGRKKTWFAPARKLVSTSRSKIIFQELDLPVSRNRTKVSK